MKRILTEDQIAEVFEALVFGGRHVKQKTLAHRYGVSNYVIQGLQGLIKEVFEETKGWTDSTFRAF